MIHASKQGRGEYRLPHSVSARLKASLSSFRNRDRAMTLAVFLGRFWSSRARMVKPFPIDRRALADHEQLGLTEAQVRGAIKTLELVGFLNRGEPPAGSLYKPTPDGLHRKPILFGFGAEYGPGFAAANARAERARNSISKSPKNNPSANSVVLMGERSEAAGRQRVALKIEPDSRLESALQKLLQAGGFSDRSHASGT